MAPDTAAPQSSKPASSACPEGAEPARIASLDDIFDRIDRCDRGETIALATTLWQNGEDEMRIASAQKLAHVAVEHLRDRGWHNPVMAESMKDSFNRLWRAFLLVAVVGFLSVAEVLWMAVR